MFIDYYRQDRFLIIIIMMFRIILFIQYYYEGKADHRQNLVHRMLDDEGARDIPIRTARCESLIHLCCARWDLSFLIRRPGKGSDGIVLLLPYSVRRRGGMHDGSHFRRQACVGSQLP